MVKINVFRPFRLNIKGVATEFKVGPHEVTPEVAAHWMVKAFSTVVEEVKAEAVKVVEEAKAEVAKVEAKVEAKAPAKAADKAPAAPAK